MTNDRDRPGKKDAAPVTPIGKQRTIPIKKG
jgi:hypothetical protein